MSQIIQEMLDQDPFGPFRIITAGGDSYDVTHAHLVALGKTWVFYCYPHADRFVFIPYNQITGVESLPSA